MVDEDQQPKEEVVEHANSLEEAQEEGDEGKEDYISEAQRLQRVNFLMDLIMRKHDDKNSEDLKRLANQISDSFGDMSQDQIIAHLKKKGEGNVFGKVLEMFPKIGVFIAEVLKDEMAIFQFFRIVQSRDKLFSLALVGILTMIIAWRWKAKDLRLGNTGFLSGQKRGLSLFAIRMGVLYYFLGTELMPTVKIAWRVFVTG